MYLSTFLRFFVLAAPILAAPALPSSPAGKEASLTVREFVDDTAPLVARDPHEGTAILAPRGSKSSKSSSRSKSSKSSKAGKVAGKAAKAAAKKGKKNKCDKSKAKSKHRGILYRFFHRSRKTADETDCPAEENQERH
ncbi:hypothetical protein MCOR25_005750 [Pyricularia grisea]|nr:hypothetical protein MCOR25_005750 [Pyricularia grisea]